MKDRKMYKYNKSIDKIDIYIYFFKWRFNKELGIEEDVDLIYDKLAHPYNSY